MKERMLFNDIYDLPGLVKQKLWLMALQRFSVAEAVGLLMVHSSNDEEELGEKEMIGDFVTELVQALFCLVKCCLKCQQ